MNVFKKIFSKIFKSNDKKTSVESRWQYPIADDDATTIPIEAWINPGVVTTAEIRQIDIQCSLGIPRSHRSVPDKKSQHRSIFEDWEVTQDS